MERILNLRLPAREKETDLVLRSLNWSVDLFGVRWTFGLGEPFAELSLHGAVLEAKILGVDKIIEGRVLDSLLWHLREPAVGRLWEAYLFGREFVLRMVNSRVGSLKKGFAEGELRVAWKVFSGLGFKDVEDSRFVAIMENPVRRAWIVMNLAKDAEENYLPFKDIQLFVNPDMYQRVYGSRKSVSSAMKEAIDVAEALSLEDKPMRKSYRARQAERELEGTEEPIGEDIIG